MKIEWVESLDDPRVAEYRNVKDAALRRERGLFMAEGRYVVELLLEFGRFEARSLFVTPTVLEAIRPCCERLGVRIPVHVASQEVYDGVVGFHLHRGCLATGHAGEPLSPETLVARSPAGRSTLVVLEALTNTENVGGVFRNIMAFGSDGVLLSPTSCDPLTRKAIRVSMGGTLRVSYARCDRWPEPLHELRAAGYQLLALDPGEGAVDLAACMASADVGDRVALILGTEGEGVSEAALACCDVKVRIPMAPDVDSINVATASGIALHALFARGARATR